jgi:hypothetical protein
MLLVLLVIVVGLRLRLMLLLVVLTMMLRWRCRIWWTCVGTINIAAMERWLTLPIWRGTHLLLLRFQFALSLVCLFEFTLVRLHLEMLLLFLRFKLLNSKACWLVAKRWAALMLMMQRGDGRRAR